MRLLLTSGGVTNTSIREALVGQLDKPIDESSALCIPTAAHATPNGPGNVGRLIRGSSPGPLCDLGWKSLGVLELTALPSLQAQHWLPLVQETDALLVGGGDCLYLYHWMKESGLADLLPSLRDETVYVGVSSGSMVTTPMPRSTLAQYFGDNYDGLAAAKAAESMLGLVDFSLLPHADGSNPENSMTNLAIVASTIPVPTYGIDDQTAIKVTDGTVEVVSEGHWKLFTP